MADKSKDKPKVQQSIPDQLRDVYAAQEENGRRITAAENRLAALEKKAGIAPVKGEKGEKGAPGDKGETGDKGDAGKQGETGHGILGF